MNTVLIVVFCLLLLWFVFSRVRVAGPNEAFIITGRKSRAAKGEPWIRSTDLSGQKVVMGTSVFVLPVVQRKQSLDLSSRRIPVDVQGAISRRGIRAHLHGVAFVRIEAAEVARNAGLIAAEAGRQATIAAAQAEVEAMRLKADALAQYGESAVLELLGRRKDPDQEAA